MKLIATLAVGAALFADAEPRAQTDCVDWGTTNGDGGTSSCGAFPLSRTIG